MSIGGGCSFFGSEEGSGLKAILNEYAEVVASARATEQMSIHRTIGVGAWKKKLVLREQLHHIASVASCKLQEISEVDIRRDVTVPGHERKFVWGEQSVGFVTTQCATRSAVIQSVDQSPIVDGHKGSTLPKRLPGSVPVVVGFVHLDYLSLIRGQRKGR